MAAKARSRRTLAVTMNGKWRAHPSRGTGSGPPGCLLRPIDLPSWARITSSNAKPWPRSNSGPARGMRHPRVVGFSIGTGEPASPRWPGHFMP